MAFKIKDGVRIGTVDVFNNAGVLLVAAPSVANALTIGTGLSGSSYNGSGAVTVAIDSTVATLTGTQTLTNKTIAAGSNTISGLTNTNLSGTAGITNANLANSAVTIGSTSVSLGATVTTFAGLTSVTSTTFVGALTGNASTATTLATARNINGTSFNGSADITITVPIATGVSGLGTGVATFLATPSSANLATALTDKTGTGVNVFATSPTLVTPVLGAATATSITATSGNMVINAAAGNNNVNLAPTGTGTVDVASKRITSVAEPTQPSDAATKNYVDTVAEGLHIHEACNAATTATLATISGGTVTYANGTLGVGATLTTTGTFTTIDGITLSNGMRIMVKDEATTANNGIYVRTSATVLTRATDFDTAAEIAGGDFVFVEDGTVYNNTAFVQTEEVLTVGTTPCLFQQFSGAGTFTAGNGLTLTGTTFNVGGTADRITVGADTVDIASTYVGQSSITTLGTIATGVWQGTLVAGQYGGTGVNNSGKTITLGGNLTTSGAFATTLTVTAATTVTLPTTGTLATLAGTETLTNKTISGASNTLSNIANASLTNSAVTIGSTSVSLGATVTTFAGLASVTSTSFVGALTGNASTATSAATLTTPRAINGVNFDGSAAITITANTPNNFVLRADGGTTEGTDLYTFNGGAAKNVNFVAGANITLTKTAGQISIAAASLTESDTLSSVTGRGATTSTAVSLNGGVTTTAITQQTGSTSIVQRAVAQATVATTSATAVDTWAIATYRSAKYIVQVTQGSNYQVSEIMVIHNGTTTSMTEFAVLETNGVLATFTSDISAPNARLLVTMGTATSATINVQRSLIVV